MDPNNLRFRVAFDQRTAVDDGKGNKKGPFVEQFRCAAAIIPKLGGETVTAERLAGRQPVLIRVRWAASSTAKVDPSWRARDVRSGEVFNIRSISNPDMRRRFLEIMADSGAFSEP